MEQNLASLKLIISFASEFDITKICLFASVIWERRLPKLKCDKGYSQMNDVEGTSFNHRLQFKHPSYTVK